MHISPLYLFVCLPLAAAQILTALPTNEANSAQPIDVPVTFFISALLGSVISLAFISFYFSKKARQTSPLITPCILLLLLGEVLYMARSSIPFDSTIALVTSSVLIGVGGGMLAVLWAWAFSYFDSETVIPSISLALALTAIVILLARLAVPYEATLVALILLLVSVIPLEILIKKINQTIDLSLGSQTQEESNHQPNSLPQASYDAKYLRREYRITGSAFALPWIVCACSWGSIATSASSLEPPDGLVFELIGLLVVSLVIFFNCFFKAKGETEHTHSESIVKAPSSKSIWSGAKEQTICVSAVVLLLLSWFASLGPDEIHLFASLFLGAAKALSICAVVSCAAKFSLIKTQDRSINLQWLASFSCFAFTASLLVAGVISYLLPGFAKLIAPTLSLLYLAVIACMPKMSKPNPEIKKPSHETLEGIDQTLAPYNFSPREKELLPYLAHGYSTKYISETLHISQNTAKTHISRIYEKMDVHSRDELIKKLATFNIPSSK